MGGRSSKTKPATGQADTVVESFTAPDGGDEAASASGKRTPVPKQSSQRRLVKEIWNSKPVEATDAGSTSQPSPTKRQGLQMSSDEESDAERKARELEKKKSKKKRRKGSREQEPVQRANAVKLNEVQVVKKPPGDVSPERVQRFEEIKVAYSMRNVASRNGETPFPSRAETKAESLARFYTGRDAKSVPPTVATNGESVTQSRLDDGSLNRPSSASSPSYQSESSPRPQRTHPSQSKDEQVQQFDARQSEQESTELLDIDELEREESSSAPGPRATTSSFQRLALTPASKMLESRSASLPTPPLHPHQLKSPMHSLRLDDADESIMSAILMETPPCSASIDRR